MIKSIFTSTIVLWMLVPIAVFAAGGKTVPCGPDVSNLIVAIANDNTVYAITPDLAAPYTNIKAKGEQISVVFQIDNCTYDFTMNLNFSSRHINVNVPGMPTMSKFFNFDRIASVPITDGSAAYVNWCTGGIQKNPDGSIKLVNGLRQDVYAPCGFDGEGYFARRSAGFSLADNCGLRFQNSPIDGMNQLANGTAFIKVYHPTANQWTLKPDTEPYTFTDYTIPSGYFNGLMGEWSALIYGGQSLAGTFIMPFKMVVSAP